MKYALTFVHKTCGYRVHATTCANAADKFFVKNSQSLIPESFDSIDAARAFADADESAKAGATVKANFRICNCAKG